MNDDHTLHNLRRANDFFKKKKHFGTRHLQFLTLALKKKLGNPKKAKVKASKRPILDFLGKALNKKA